MQTPRVKGSVPCQSGVVGLQVTHNFCPTWLQTRGSHALPPATLPLWIRLFARTVLRTQENTYLHLPVYYIIKATTKDTDEQPDEEINRQSPGGSWARELFSHGVGVRRLPDVWTCSCLHHEEASIKIPTPWGLDSFQVGEPAPNQEPIQSCHIRTKGTPTTQEIPRVLGALCQGLVKDQVSKQKMLLVLLSLRKCHGF